MIAHRYLPGLRIDRELLYRAGVGNGKRKQERWEQLHLRQSPLDRSCGLTCVLMLAMLFDGMARDRAVSVAWSARPKLQKLWAVAQAGYFRGTSPAAIVRHLEALGHSDRVVRLKGPHSDLFVHAAAEVASGNGVLILIGDSPKAGLHWIMLTGVEYSPVPDTDKSHNSEQIATALLGLDPESPPPLCSGFNWKMQSRDGNRPIVTSNGTDRRRKLQGAVILRSSR